jgi:hypothetical protein
MLFLLGLLTLLATFAAAHSTNRAPLRAITLARNADILTHNHHVTAVSTFDVAFDVDGQRIRLSLEPNHDLFVEGARISYLDADGNIARHESIDRLQHKVFKGTAKMKRGNRWDTVGWARISIHRDGLHPLFEGTFTVVHDHHHVKLSSNYKATRMAQDPDIDMRDDEVMVIFKDSDMGVGAHAPHISSDEHMELRKRAEAPACTSDQLGFNTHPDHPVYAGMRARRDTSLASMPIDLMFGKRQIDGQPGGNGAGINLVSSIGSTAGCPSTRKVALVGVAADCNYITSFNKDRNRTQANIIDQINSASELFESTFQISLGLANVLITEPECPTQEQQSTPWNQGCSDSVNIQKRLNLFSTWRGKQDDNYSHWTLLTTCNTGSAVGLAWLGQACVKGSQPNSGSADETVAGANVVVRTAQEWQVIAHETGHTFGAVHDCTAAACGDPNTVNSQQCCPLSSGTCNAGEQFIMNPSTAQGITKFSPCSIGNICSALKRNSVESSCLTNNRDVTTITGQKCGNGIVEGDEQCDCGGKAGCGNNNCCDPTTCKFKTNAVCDDSNEDCCKDCQFASSTTVCRPSAGECDPEERCTGSDPYCPKDEHKKDTTSCNGTDMTCASGQCTSRDLQCKTVMGSYTQNNDTYACDRRGCTLSCRSPAFGPNTCYSMQQNFLDGTPCAGGFCENGNCNGNFGGEVKDWFERHKTLVIGVAAGVGGFIVLCIFMCCWRSYRRRRNRKAYAAKMGGAPPMYPGPPPQQRGDRRGRGPPPQQPPMGQGWAPQGQNQWAPQTGHGPPIPTPPPLHQRPMRYA